MWARTALPLRVACVDRHLVCIRLLLRMHGWISLLAPGVLLRGSRATLAVLHTSSVGLIFRALLGTCGLLLRDGRRSGVCCAICPDRPLRWSYMCVLFSSRCSAAQPRCPARCVVIPSDMLLGAPTGYRATPTYLMCIVYCLYWIIVTSIMMWRYKKVLPLPTRLRVGSCPFQTPMRHLQARAAHCHSK